MPNPLSEQGYDVDIETLLPADVLVQENEMLAKRRLRKIAENSQELINELSGNSALVKEAVKLFIERVNILIKSDPECQAYEKLFNMIQHSVNVGKGVVTDRAKNLVNL